jgi:hypothetical protein
MSEVRDGMTGSPKRQRLAAGRLVEVLLSGNGVTLRTDSRSATLPPQSPSAFTAGDLFRREGQVGEFEGQDVLGRQG